MVKEPMKKIDAEKRTAALHVKVKPAAKAAADEMAVEDRRSLAMRRRGGRKPKGRAARPWL